MARRSPSTAPGPHPLRRAIVGLLLGVGLGVVAALLRPRGRDEGAPLAGG